MVKIVDFPGPDDANNEAWEAFFMAVFRLEGLGFSAEMISKVAYATLKKSEALEAVEDLLNARTVEGELIGESPKHLEALKSILGSYKLKGGDPF